MQVDFRLKDFIDISDEINICKLRGKYIVSAYTNKLEGEINAVLKISDSEDQALGRNVLFSIRNGEQISLSDLRYEEQLIIPQEDLDKIKSSLSVKFELFENSKSIWETIIDKLNSKHISDNNNNYESISNDLPVPNFTYINTNSSFLTKIINIFKKKK